MAGVLEQLTAAQKKLAEVKTAQDALDLMQMADAAAYLARELELGTAAVNTAVVVKAKTMRRLADIVDKGQAKGEIRTAGQPSIARAAGNTPEPLPIPSQRLAECRVLRDRYSDEQLDALAEEAEEELSTRQLIRSPHVANNSGDNEWYTPASLIEMAREAMGGIDLDPASSAEANATVKAEQYWTADDDGLTRPWAGRIWLNPPYARGLVGQFTERLVSEWQTGNVTAACLLVNNATDTQWWQNAAKAAGWVCFLEGRVRFWQPGSGSGAPLQGQTVLGYGCEGSAFKGAGVVL